MERKKELEEIMALEEARRKKVLSALVFPESFEHILDELGREISSPVLVSLIRDLMRENKIRVIDPESGKTVFYHDSDRMNEFYYQATSTGLDSLEEQS